MKIDLDEARRVAALAHLQFDDAGLERMAAEMTKILTYIDQLSEVDVEGFEERDATVTPFRADEPHASLDRELVARNAPSWRDGLFVVPKVIEGNAGVATMGAAASTPPSREAGDE
ncbi:MAG TPA: Asp-tRNA(Asn)/Glu-tRNA(Gln) amidotransferase subunit GatC [Thermoanaerobaculia bacterium]|nr:Asp-tRNA(Asn)/Glu-tRNA(Gln) amidotransferase subunit GatC [Thermoanaerobaculia bacterium]